MIKITVVKNNQNIMSIEATGHSGYAESGQDIVCAAISTLTQNLILGLTEVVGIEPKCVVDESIPHLSVALPQNLSAEKMKSAQILTRSTYLGLKQVANEYSKFIKIKEK